MCQGDFVSLSEWITPDTTECQYNDKSQELCNAAAVSNSYITSIYCILYIFNRTNFHQNADAAESARVLVLVTADSDTFTEATVEIASAFLSSLANSTNLTTEVKSLFKLLL